MQFDRKNYENCSIIHNISKIMTTVSSKTKSASTFSSAQVCLQTGINYDTLKYYCQIGLIPNMSKKTNGRMTFSASDISWIKTLLILRECEMPIEQIREYFQLCQNGNQTINQRLKLLDKRASFLRRKRKEIENCLDILRIKQNQYRTALSNPQTQADQIDGNLRQPSWRI